MRHANQHKPRFALGVFVFAHERQGVEQAFCRFVERESMLSPVGSSFFRVELDLHASLCI